MKRIICILTAIMLLLLSVPAMAADGFRIYAENTEAIAGGTVLVTLKAENNTGMALGRIVLDYDKDKLIPVSVSRGELLSGAAQFTSNVDDPSFDPSEAENITVSWMNYVNITGDGNIAVIEFAAMDSASGEAEIGVTVSELSDASLNNITAQCDNGTVTFDGGENPVDEDVLLGFAQTTETSSDNEFGVSVTVSAYLNEALNAAFIYTIYDSSGNLLAVKTKTESLRAGKNDISLGELNTAARKDGEYSVKVYMWNSLDGMKALTQEPIERKYQ